MTKLELNLRTNTAKLLVETEDKIKIVVFRKQDLIDNETKKDMELIKELQKDISNSRYKDQDECDFLMEMHEDLYDVVMETEDRIDNLNILDVLILGLAEKVRNELGFEYSEELLNIMLKKGYVTREEYEEYKLINLIEHCKL